jgi:hypothetical protein
VEIGPIVEALVAELEVEKFGKPDDEHTEIAISSGNWAVTVDVSGLMSLDDLSWITGSSDDVPIPTVHLRAQTRGDVVDMLRSIAEGRIDAVRAAPWVAFEKLPPHRRDLFRKGR